MSHSALPGKVVSYALAHGVHNDCLAAGTAGACMDCEGIVMDALDHFYGHLEDPEAVLAKILTDLVLGES